MNSLKQSLLGMTAIIGFITIGYAGQAFGSFDAYIIFKAKDGKIIKVKINTDGTFTTPPLNVGTYSWSFGATQMSPSSSMGASNVSSDGSLSTSGVAGKPVSSTGDNPTESVSLNFTKIEMKCMEQHSAREASSGMATGKRQYKPLTIIKVVDKSSPTLMTDLGAVDIDTDGDTFSGTVIAETSMGVPVGWDLAVQKK